MYQACDFHQRLYQSIDRNWAMMHSCKFGVRDGRQENVLYHNYFQATINKSANRFQRTAQLETTHEFADNLRLNYHSAYSSMPRYYSLCELEVSAPYFSCSSHQTVTLGPPSSFGITPYPPLAKYEPASLAACSTGADEHRLHPEARAPAETYASRLSASLRRADAADAADAAAVAGTRRAARGPGV